MGSLKQDLKEFFDPFEYISAVYLFGSQVTHRTNAESDIDIAILFDPERIPDFTILNQLRCTLEERFHHHHVDLVVLNKTNPILTHQIFKKGLRVLVKNQRHLSSLMARSLVDYEDIKRIRAPIENKWLAGAAHG